MRYAEPTAPPWRLFMGIAAMFFGLLVLSACGGGGGPEAGGSAQPPASSGQQVPAQPAQQSSASVSIDACQLITKTEAQAAVGAPVGDPSQTSIPPVFGCDYRYPSSIEIEVGVSVIVYQDNKQAADAFQMALDINKYPPVSGVGERAYDSRPIQDLTVLRGRYELAVDVGLADSDRNKEFALAKELALKALGRLP